MAFSESDLNPCIAEVLGGMSRSWKTWSQLTRQVREGAGLALDVLVRAPGRQSVAIENEYSPGHTVRRDAESRLGKTLVAPGFSGPVSAVVELLSPTSLKNCRTAAEARERIAAGNVEFSYALLTGNNPDHYIRFPDDNSYITGNIRDLAMFVANASVPHDALRHSVTVLQEGVEDAVAILHEAIGDSDVTKANLAELLRQDFTDETIDQALGIGATVMINALVFQQRLAGPHDVRNVAQMQDDGDMTQAGLLAEWTRILEINYWSVFALAKAMVHEVRQPPLAQGLVDVIARTADKLATLGVADSHDLAGVVFQRFVTDRKYLATFYTRPESATLLAHLAVPAEGGKWGDRDHYRKFRMADYTCGTGTLIHAAYDRIARLYETAGGNPKLEHAYMIGSAITAADIMPSAAHLTASMLSSMYPDETYSDTRVVIPAYGRGDDGQVSLGSLELLSPDARMASFFGITSPATELEGTGERRTAFTLDMPPADQDLVIMNPPFTRAMSDWIKGDEGTWKPFNALGNARDTQQLMRVREHRLVRGTCYNGYQSMPSAFCAVADHMVGADGVVALVLPLTCCQGVSWQKFRDMLNEKYGGVLIVGITRPKASDQAWSADTNMAEVLVVARKGRNGDHRDNGRGVFVSLHSRPTSPMEATETARAIHIAASSEALRRLEDGPYGGTPIKIGRATVGEAVSAPLSASYQAVGVRDLALAQFMESLSRGRMWFPRQPRERTPEISVAPIATFARVGRAANNIANNSKAAFDKAELVAAPSYPMLWSNRSRTQRAMIVEPDKMGRVRRGRERLAEDIWDTRSRSHIAAECAFSSQSLAVAFTEERVIGGRGWPNVQLDTPELEKAFAVWGNSTLGLIQYWYHSSRQQGNRGIMPVRAIRTLPWLKVTDLTSRALDAAVAIFDDLKNQTLLQARNAYCDEVRQEIDERLLRHVLLLPRDASDGLALLRRKWCSEPTVHGGHEPAQ